jgi:DNA-binding transcriptional LysR family regulator
MLDPRQLDALVAVIENGSFGVAAKARNITLAPVSLRIKSLEAGRGQRLLVRATLAVGAGSPRPGGPQGLTDFESQNSFD